MPSPGEGQTTPPVHSLDEPSATRPVEFTSDNFIQEPLHSNIFVDALRLAARRWKLVCLLWLTVLSLFFIYAITSVPKYSAEGVVQISARDSFGTGNPMLQLAQASSNSELQTEIEIIRRRDFVLAVAHKLKFAVTDPKEPQQFTRDLDITLRGTSPVDPALKQLRSALKTAQVVLSWHKPVLVDIAVEDFDIINVGIHSDRGEIENHRISVSQPLTTDKIELEFSKLPSNMDHVMTVLFLNDGSLYDQLISRLQISSLGSYRERTNLIQVKFLDTDREHARSFVQGLMEHYLRQNMEWQSLRASRSAQFISEQLQDVGKKLDQQEQLLREFSELNQAVDISTQGKVAIESLANLEAERSSVLVQEQLVAAVLRELQETIKTDEPARLTANFFDDHLLTKIIGTLTEEEIQYEILHASLTTEHPILKSRKLALERHRKEVMALLHSEQKNLSKRKQELDRVVESHNQHLESYPNKQLQLSRLNRDVGVSQRLYGFLLEKLQEAEILKAATTTDKRILDDARQPYSHSSPHRKRTVFYGLIAGLVFGISFVNILRFTSQRLDTVESIRETVRYPVYATIPHFGGEHADPNKKVLVSIDDIWRNSHQRTPEAFRTLRVNVGFVPITNGRGRIIQVTSSQPGEGKSTVLSNLAVSLAKSGSRVLIVDLDLRRPTQHRIWAIPRSPGFTESGAAGMREDCLKIQRLEKYNVDIATSGSKVPETLTIMLDPRFPGLIRTLAKSYDYVLIDSPPVFVADALVVGQHVDLVLIAARPGVVTRSNARHAIEYINRLKTARRGLVLNGVTRAHSEYYANDYYYYGGSYGESAEESEQPTHDSAA